MPIEIEETFLGTKIESLIKLLDIDSHSKDGSTIEAYNYVSFRILNRIADLLSFVKKDYLFG